jgi:hypothetical protein
MGDTPTPAKPNPTAVAMRDSIVERVAVQLKENYNSLRLLNGGLPELKADDNAAFMDLAREAMEKRSLGGVPLKDLNSKLTENPAGRQMLAGWGVDSLEKKIPTNEQIDKIGAAVAAAVDANIDKTGVPTKNGDIIGGNAIKNGAIGALGSFLSGNLGELLRIDDKTREITAAKIAQDTRKRLGMLAADPTMAGFLNESTIADITEGVRQGVVAKITGTGAKEDKLAKAIIKPLDDATRDAVYDEVHRSAFNKTRSGIQSAIKEKTSGGIMGFIFGILEMLGLDKIVAKWFGIVIPEQQDIDQVASVVADTARKLVKEQGNLPKADLVTVTGRKTLEALQQNHKDYPSFTNGQLVEIAGRAATAMGENYDSLPKMPPSEAVQQQASAAAQPSRDITTGGTTPDTPPNPGNEKRAAGAGAGAAAARSAP